MKPPHTLVGAATSVRSNAAAHPVPAVLGGLAVGAAVAVAVTTLVSRPAQAPVRVGGTDIMLPAAPDGDGLFLVANSSSGEDVVGKVDPLTRIRERMPRALVHTLTDGETPDSVIGDALASATPPRILGVCGGDGTVSAVAHCAREARLPLAVIPGGTFNHFARALGNDSVDDALDAVVSGRGARVDVAEIRLGGGTPTTVLNAASVGIYPAFVLEREELQHRLGKWLGGVVAAIRVLRTADPIDIEIDGDRRTVWSVFAGVDRNSPEIPAPLQRQRLDGGVLDIRILPARSRVHAAASLSFGRKTTAVLRAMGLIPRASAVETFTTESLTVTVRPKHGQPAGFAYDGEAEEVDAGESANGYTSTVTIIDGGLDVYCRPAVD